MNEIEIIVSHILESNYDEFDPSDYVKSAKNRESAVEVYNGPLVRVIQPLAGYTVNNYLHGGAEIDDSVFKEMSASGPIYLAVDKADHDNLAIIQPSSERVWNAEGKERPWKDISHLISSSNDPEDKNWLDLQQGLATYFMAQIAKKKNVGQWVKYLTMIGRTDLAANYARYLGRAKLPFGKSIDAVLAMKKAGKRSRNRIARLMKNQDDVKWGEKGFWLLFNDWEDLAPFYGESRDYNYAKNAEKIFSGDTFEWFDNAGNKPEEAWSEINDRNMSLIKQLLVNRTVYNSDGEEHLATREFVDELTDDEIKDIVCDRGNKGGECDDIYSAVRMAADDAWQSQQESAYYEGYQHALMSAWGLQEDKTIKWIKVGKNGKGGNVRANTGTDEKVMLGLWFPYSTLEEWIGKWKEDEYEDDFYGDIHDLAKAYLEKIEPNDEYFGDTDTDYFNQQLGEHLHEIDLTSPERQTDPNQPELPLEGEPEASAGELQSQYSVHVGNPPDEKVYKGVDKQEATKYRDAMKPTRDDITFRAESFLAKPFSRIEEADLDPKSFVRNVPLFYVLAWEWEPGQFMYFGRYPSDNYAQLGHTPQDELTLKFDSAEEAQNFINGAQWGTPEWGAEKPFAVTPVQAAGPKLEESAHDFKIEFEASDEAAESLVPLLKELKKMGSQGSSRNIKIEDWDGRSSFGFDGDGASKIGEIKVNGEVVEAAEGLIGDCRDEALVDEIFGSVSEFARLVEQFGDEFVYGGVRIGYDPDSDVHYFYRHAQESLLQEAIYKLSTTQIDLPKEIGGHVIQWGELNIAEEDLYIDEKDGCGRETEQHVTVLYGLTDPTPPEALTHIVETTKPFLIEFGGISVFENEKYDVIKLDVISEELHNLHLEIRRSCPNENKYPDYIPHCTIAYVKPGTGKKYKGMDVFKTAQVARDFWAYDLLFKGAGDSEDGQRVVQLISFDKSKDFERDEPEAGEQRYPQATEEEPELAVAENLDPKAFLDRHVPVACPECCSHNLSDPDEEGLVDCRDCGMWFDPFHPANKPVAESEGEIDTKGFLNRHYEEWVVVADDPKRQHPLLYLSDSGVKFTVPQQLARRFASKEEAQQVIELIRTSVPRSIRDSINAVKLPGVNEAEEFNAKEFLNRTTRYRIRMGAGAQTRYIWQNIGTGQMMWKDFDEATVFTADEAEVILAQIGSEYGGQPVDAELVEDDPLGESEVDPKRIAMSVPTRYILRYKLSTSPKYLVASAGKSSRLGSSEFDNIRITSNPAKATVFNMHDTTRWCQAFNDNYEPVPVQEPVQESVGPFDDDGLPGEVSTFLRKVRSKRPRPKTKEQAII